MTEKMASDLMEYAGRLAQSKKVRVLVTNLSEQVVLASATTSHVIHEFLAAMDIAWMHLDLAPAYLKLQLFGPGYKALLQNERLRAASAKHVPGVASSSIHHESPLLLASTEMGGAPAVEEADTPDSFPNNERTPLLDIEMPDSPVVTTVDDHAHVSNQGRQNPSASARIVDSASQSPLGSHIVTKKRSGDFDTGFSVIYEPKGVVQRSEDRYQFCYSITKSSTSCQRKRLITLER